MKVELRRDPATQTWVITGTKPKRQLGIPDGAACPFCQEPSARAIAKVRDGRGQWVAYSIPDKEPVFRIEVGFERAGVGMYDRMKNVGAHEVVVESPRHDATFATLSKDDLAPVLGLYAERVRDLKKDQRIKCVFVLKNVGRDTGSLISHPHGHIVAPPVTPRRLKSELVAAQRYFERKERCVFCDMLKQETASPVRLVAANARFVAFCPYASRVPYEVWILPREHHHAFEEQYVSEPAGFADLAELLSSVARRVGTVAGSYHLLLHNAPNTNSVSSKPRWTTLRDDFHWHIEILPSLPGEERFEAEEAFPSNPVRAEDAAEVLRKAE